MDYVVQENTVLVHTWLKLNENIKGSMGRDGKGREIQDVLHPLYHLIFIKPTQVGIDHTLDKRV